MKLTIQKQDLTKFSCDLLAIHSFSPENGEDSLDKKSKMIALPPGTNAVNKALRGLLVDELTEEYFKGKFGEVYILHTHGKISAKKVAVIGLGKRSEFDLEKVRRIGAHVTKIAKKNNAKRVGAIFHGAIAGLIYPRDGARAFTEGVLLADYEYLTYRGEEYKKERIRRAIDVVTLLEVDPKKLREAEQGIKEGELAARATTYARDLVNEPASVMTPAHLVKHARDIAKKSNGKIGITVLNRADCAKKGMGAFLAVAQGATEEPYFVHMVYKGGAQAKSFDSARDLKQGRTHKQKKIALVGKAITFDSGGLQIKPDTAMETMKLDMAGAAAVLGVFSVLTELNPSHEIHGIFAATENMPGNRAYKPGDIVRAMNGKTIEIAHTDAEGRVTLADSLSYAATLKPDALIDLATLTGACMVALGEEVGGLFTNNQKLALGVGAAALKSGERLWELPMIEEYRDFIKSSVADVRNSGKTRYGGAITAGLFLEEFVNKTPWVHLDIAGPAWAERELLPYVPVGGSGFGVRTLLEFLKNL